MPNQRPYRGITEDGKWVYGSYIHFVSDNPQWPYDSHKIRPLSALSETPVIPETVGQSTGLKDKNGKDLDWWEGDIYEFYLYGRFVITFIEGAFMFVPEGGKVGKVNHPFCNEVAISVIQPRKVGTIHDHLLKSKENHNNG